MEKAHQPTSPSHPPHEAQQTSDAAAQPEMPLVMSLDATRRASAANAQRATQRRRDAWHRGFHLRAILAFVLISATRADADFRSPLDEATSVQQQLRSAVDQAARSVYAVTAFADAPSEPSLYGGQVTGAALAAIAEQLERSCGSAFAIDAAGHLITNEHVISGAASIWVTDDAGRVFPAIVVGSDPRTDLAVLYIPAETQPLSIATEPPQRGDLAVALGNPDGLATEGNVSASVGCVSAVGRSLAALSARETRSYADLVQVTTPIAIGGSGGPLVDLNGRAIGIISAVATADRNRMPVGFAIPLTPLTIERLTKLARGEEINHPYFGITISTVSSDGRSAGLQAATRITRVEPSTPADGLLQEGDLILSLNNSPITDDRHFIALAAASTIDEETAITIRRGDKLIEVRLRPTRRPMPASPVTRATQRFTWAGVSFENADGGVRVLAKEPDATMPLEVGTVVCRVANQPVPDIATLARILFEQAGKPLTLDVAMK